MSITDQDFLNLNFLDSNQGDQAKNSCASQKLILLEFVSNSHVFKKLSLAQLAINRFWFQSLKVSEPIMLFSAQKNSQAYDLGVFNLIID